MDFAGLARPLTVGTLTIPNRVFLAPMSGITDRAFRLLAAAHGAGAVVSEMIASGELAKGRAGSLRRLEAVAGLPHIVQLAGREAAPLAEAARMAEAEGADVIDINMGCPAKKVTGGYAGSALMRDLDHAEQLIDAVIAAVRVPVTVKMRLGWDVDVLNAPDLAARAERCGASWVTIHGRTRCQLYQGQADWHAIARVKQAVGIPVIANGDVVDARTAGEALAASGADAVMVGRGSYGAPWLAGSIAARAAGTAPRNVPSGASELRDYVLAHHEDMLVLHGRDIGLRQARKHLGWYLDRHAPLTTPALRQQLLTADCPVRVKDLLSTIFESAEVATPHRTAA
jgi:tRNA-dihydrouridine synthase B